MARAEATDGGGARPRVRIEAVDGATTRPMRQRILRPHLTLDEVSRSGEEVAGSVHFAARDEDGTVIGVVTLLHRSPPWDQRRAGWQLRGMATEPRHQGGGVGRALVERLLAHVAGEGGGVVWCNARVPAAGFYRAMGFVETGEPWEEPVVGPHIVMWRAVEVAPG